MTIIESIKANDFQVSEDMEETGNESVYYKTIEGNIRYAEPDGYLRRSKVQELVIPEDYYRNIFIKACIAVGFLIIAGIVAYSFYKLGYLSVK